MAVVAGSATMTGVLPPHQALSCSASRTTCVIGMPRNRLRERVVYLSSTQSRNLHCRSQRAAQAEAMEAAEEIVEEAIGEVELDVRESEDVQMEELRPEGTIEEVELDVRESEDGQMEELRPDDASHTSRTATLPLSESQSLLKSFKEAVAANDEELSVEVTLKFQSFEEERDSMLDQVTKLTKEVSLLRDYSRRLSAEFEIYRRIWKKEQSALSARKRAEVIESLLPMIGSFAKVRSSVKPKTDIEKKIANSYLGIDKQFLEVMKGLGAIQEPIVEDPPYVRVISFFTRFWDRLTQSLVQKGNKNVTKFEYQILLCPFSEFLARNYIHPYIQLVADETRWHLAAS